MRTEAVVLVSGRTESLAPDLEKAPTLGRFGVLTSSPKWMERFQTQSEAEISESSEPRDRRHSEDDFLSRWPSLSSPEGLFRALDWIGTLTFALTGSALGGKYGMDLLGCVIVGSITAIGGGTIRDVLLGTTPVFWVTEWEYPVISMLAAVVGFLVWEECMSELWIHFVLDTIGLGMFTCVGAQTAIRKKCRAPIVCWCALINACGGGVIRDVLVGRPVRILHNTEAYQSLYGACAVFGGIAYWWAYRAAKMRVRMRVVCGFGVTAVLRYVGWTHRVALPSPRARWVMWLPQFR
jgi:uncharacterized membrane protein YeiH